MRFKMECIAPEDLEYKMTITMSVSDWRDLKSRMDDKWPGYNFKSAIDSILDQANKVYFPDNPDN